VDIIAITDHNTVVGCAAMAKEIEESIRIGDEVKEKIKSGISEQEMENFCLKCVKVLKKLYEKNCFVFDGTIEDRKKAYEAKSVPVLKFLNENYEKDINSDIPFFEVYEKYLSYLEENGLRLVSKVEFGKTLERQGYEKARKNVEKDGKTTTWYFVVGLKEKNNNNNNNNVSTTYPPTRVETSRNIELSVNTVIIPSENQTISVEKVWISNSCDVCEKIDTLHEFRGRKLCSECLNKEKGEIVE
jgi:hypothetical protein